MHIPVLRPSLPDAELLLPYFQKIDQNRVYSNFGPLSRELSRRLESYFHVQADSVICASSGTTAPAAAILAAAGRAGREKPLAIVPAFTFVGTALAAELCGYEVVFSDISAQSWTLQPESLASSHDLDRVAIVIPVAPFGRPVPQQPWQDFRQATGVPFVIDTAA
jgi:dTDP-4-amino-4,6-dideoxygalactose transaminase